jgi:hypothetical protein
LSFSLQFTELLVVVKVPPYFFAARAANSSFPNAVPAISPTSFGSLGQQEPCAPRLTRIARDPRDDLSRFSDELPLPARESTPGGVTTCTRTVRAEACAAVFTVEGGIR